MVAIMKDAITDKSTIILDLVKDILSLTRNSSHNRDTDNKDTTSNSHNAHSSNNGILIQPETGKKDTTSNSEVADNEENKEKEEEEKKDEEKKENEKDNEEEEEEETNKMNKKSEEEDVEDNDEEENQDMVTKKKSSVKLVEIQYNTRHRMKLAAETTLAHQNQPQKNREVSFPLNRSKHDSEDEDENESFKIKRKATRKLLSHSKRSRVVESIFKSIFDEAHELILIQQKSDHDIKNFFNKHVSVTRVTSESRIKLTSQTMAIPEDMIYYINLRNKVNRFESFVTIQKSTLDNAGFGLFANRDFKKDECIGVYLGLVTKRNTDSLYAFEWNHGGEVYYVVPEGGIGNPLYFGMHMTNHSVTQENMFVEDDMYLYAKRNITIGEELFIDYGSKYII